MSKNELIALAMVVIAEIVRGGREAIHAIKTWFEEYTKNPTRFWRHLQHTAFCMIVCTLALSPAYFYLMELLKHQA